MAARQSNDVLRACGQWLFIGRLDVAYYLRSRTEKAPIITALCRLPPCLAKEESA